MIACGNHQAHGTRPGAAGHHATRAEVRECFTTGRMTHEEEIQAWHDREAELRDWEWEAERRAALGPDGTDAGYLLNPAYAF